MGCFNTTCCLTGLPIVNQEKVAFGLIALQSKQFDFGVEYPAGHYGFVTPIFTSKYNDYGSIEWDSISRRDLWDWVWGRISRKITPTQDLAQMDAESKFHHMTYGDLTLETQCLDMKMVNDQPAFCTASDHKRVHIWMCHEWAFKAMLKEAKANPERVEKQAENYVMQGYIEPGLVDAYIKVLDTEADKRTEDQKAITARFIASTHREQHWISGRQGTFVEWVAREVLCDEKEILCEVLGQFKEEFKKAVIETANCVFGMGCLGKGIMPSFFFGVGQGHEAGNTAKFAALVAKKAAEREVRWNKGY